MTALDALFGRAPVQPLALGLESPAVPLTSTTLLDWLDGPRVHSGITVTESGSLAMPAVWRAVTLISGVCASLPLHAYRRGDETRLALAAGPEAELLEDPHPDMTPLELWEAVFGSLCTWGNAYLRILRDPNGLIRELWWIAPNRVKAGRAADGTKVYTLDGSTDPANALSDRQLLHIPGFSVDGVVGLSPIRLHREGIGLAMAAEQFGARLFGSGGLATGILISDQRLDDGQADAIKSRWKQAGTGLDTAHDIRVLGSGAKYQQLTIPPEDAQFLESRRFQVVEVARMFGLPPHLLAESGDASNWGTGIEALNRGLITFTLAPSYLGRVEQRLTKLWRPPRVAGHAAPRRTYAKYALEGLLRGDSAARAAFYTAMWNIGAYDTNEVRGYEDKGPVEGGDVRYRPLNMGVLGQPDAAKTPGPDPAAPAAAPATPPADQGVTADA